MPYTSLNVSDPVAVGIDATGVTWASFLVKVGAIFGLATVMLVMLLGQSRVFFSMSGDGLLPEWCSAVHPRFRTPWISTIFVGIFVAIFAALVPIEILGELVSIGTLLAFVIVFRRHVDSAAEKARSASPLQDAVGSVRADHGSRRFRWTHGEPAGRYVAPADCVAHHWNGRLFHVWAKAQQSTECHRQPGNGRFAGTVDGRLTSLWRITGASQFAGRRTFQFFPKMPPAASISKCCFSFDNALTVKVWSLTWKHCTRCIYTGTGETLEVVLAD